MSVGSSANNSWTILSPEETAAETLRPLAEGTEHHEEHRTSAAGSGEIQPADSAEGLPAEGHLVSEEKSAELSRDTQTTSLEVSGSFVPSTDALSQSEGLPEGPAQSDPDPDSFSDSYAHITPSPDEPPASLLNTETLGVVEFTQEEETLAEEGTLHPLNGEWLQQEGEESDLFLRTSDEGKQADSHVDSEAGEEKTEKRGEEGEPEVRRRRSLLAALERIGRTEREDEGEEEFQLPQREEDSGFSVNKCILGAVILLGLGTIFFSGVFMDLDEESDYGTRELKDAESPGKQEWLSPEVSPPPVDDSTELLNKLAKGNQQISVLQAQLQAQKEELEVAKGAAEDGAKERLRWEEVEKENSRLKKEVASVPVLQKENEKLKRELESALALQRELETLRPAVTELKLTSASEGAQAPMKPTTTPSSGQPVDSMQDTAGSRETQPKKPWDDQKEKKKDMKKDKIDMGEKIEWKERGKSEWKEGEKNERKDGFKTEWKKGKHEQGKFDNEKHKEGKQKRHSDEIKQGKEKDWKKEKGSRGDEGKPWKNGDGKKEWIEKSARQLKEERDWKKAKHEKGNEGTQWRGKEEKKDWKVGKDHGETHKGKEELKGEREWKKEKGKDGLKESSKEKWEKREWKEKGERKDWKGKDRDWKGKDRDWKDKDSDWKDKDRDWKGKDSDWKDKDRDWKGKNSRDPGKEGKGKFERKQWEEGKNHGKERKDEGKEWKSKNDKDDKEWKRKDEHKEWNKNDRKSENGKDKKEWKRKDENKDWGKKEEQSKRGGQKDQNHHGDWKEDRSGSQKHKDEHKFAGHRGHEGEHLWGDRKAPHTGRRPSLEQPEYWVQQRARLQHHPEPPQHCDSLETCSQAEGLLPVPFPEFDAILQTYLAKAAEAGVDDSKRDELKKLASEFFKDGVFVHDQMSFRDFVEDVADILEDMVEGDENGEEEDSAIEEEMEGFEREVLEKFWVPGAGEKVKKSKTEWRKESGRGRG